MFPRKDWQGSLAPLHSPPHFSSACSAGQGKWRLEGGGVSEGIRTLDLQGHNLAS